MQLSCTVQCRCISACNADQDQTRPDPTRPDPFYLSPLRANTLLLLPQLQKAVHRLWKSAIERSGMEVGRPTPADPAACELPGCETSDPTETPTETETSAA